MNILYIGPNDSEWAQMNRPVSLAAAKWSRGFLTALSKRCRLTALTHTYEVAWPKGRVLWRGYDPRLYNEGWDCVPVSYPVLKFVREVWFRHAYSAKARRIVAERDIDVVLLYNCDEPWNHAVMRDIKASCGDNVKVVPIILDGDDPRKDGWGWVREAAKSADAFVALSWWVHSHLTEQTSLPSFHFDGGADGWRGEPPSASADTERRPFLLAHTGALDQWRGLDMMVGVVKRLTARRKDVKFVFCGKSTAAKLREVFGGNPQVELPGFVSEAEMGRICNAADVLLNVRDPNHPDNILNYPSKLPHYLSFGRPIVSTRLKSLSPDYDEVVEFAVDDTVGSYVEKVEEVLSWSLSRRIEAYDRIKGWFLRRKSWDVMTDGLVKWLEGVEEEIL